MSTLLSAELMPGTTPILKAVVSGEDITDSTVYVSIESGDIIYTKSNYHDDGTISLEKAYDENSNFLGTEVTVMYTQEDTLCLSPGYARVQIGWVSEDDTADKTNMGRVHVPNTLIREVMRYGKDNT